MKRVLLISGSKIIEIEEQSEQAFSDSINNNVVQELRESGINLLKTIVYYQDDHLATNIIVNYKNSMQNLTHSTHSDHFFNLLTKEAVYFVMARLAGSLRTYLDYEYEITHVISTDLLKLSFPFLNITQFLLIEQFIDN